MIDLNPSYAPNSASFRDPSGFVYQLGDTMFRQVNLSYKEQYDQLMDSGLYSVLTAKGLLVQHKEVEDLNFPEPNGYKIIQPDRIHYISYPYEWCFSQLKDAALLTLQIQKLSLKHGMALKDASAYNIQFSGATPVFIDSLSFEKFEGKPWVAYKQFCQHFLAPLAMMSKSDHRLSKLLSCYIDGVPLDLASKILPASTKCNLGLLTHIHLHAKSQKKFSNQGREEKTQNKLSAIHFTTEKSIALLDHLINTVKKLEWKLADTEWGNYYSDTNYEDDALKEKSDIVKEFFGEIPDNLHIVQDLGANDGKFGRLVSPFANQVICHDVDEVAVEKNYLAAKAAKDRIVLPLVQDLSNPSASIGWAGLERMSFSTRSKIDVTMALALIHHLAISNNVPFEQIANFFSTLSRYLIIEFVEKSDSQVQRLLATREDIFTNYSIEEFENTFSRHYQIRKRQNISGTNRTLFLMESQSLI